jgi:hypothetical protein
VDKLSQPLLPPSLAVISVWPDSFFLNDVRHRDRRGFEDGIVRHLPRVLFCELDDLSKLAN